MREEKEKANVKEKGMKRRRKRMSQCKV